MALKMHNIFCRKRQLMLQENGEEELNEYQLFHGTAPNVVDAICAENFDFRLSGAHGTAMGHGKIKIFDPLQLLFGVVHYVL